MKIAIFGATGALGGQCLRQCLDAGFEVTLLLRSPDKLAADLAAKCTVYSGDALDADAVDTALSDGCDAVLFAIGVDKGSPENLCATATEHIINAMRANHISRLVWCGGGSTLLPDDQVTMGARFVELFTKTFMGLRHRDKAEQLKVLNEAQDIEWIGIRPLQMLESRRTEVYRLGYDAFNGMSKISFADCAHAMVGMLENDDWLHKAPIVQY
ncbi:MAG: NAD(P)-dependent oxidoreductase [Pseudomonadales bacterium]